MNRLVGAGGSDPAGQPAPPAGFRRLPLHPRRGPHRPLTGTPARRPGSVRRTSSLDTLRPDGLGGRVVMLCRARDLLTDTDGQPHVLDEAEVRVEIAPGRERAVSALETVPPLAGTAELVGAPLAAGFRSRVGRALPEQHTGHTLLNLLLDDLTGASLVGGYPTSFSGLTQIPPGLPTLPQADVCAGWATEATLVSEYHDTGRIPVVTGPPAPPLTTPGDDPWAWHRMDPLPPHGMRRVRRLDLGPGDPLAVDVHFRDSHQGPDGLETIIHEYLVHGGIEPRGLTVTALDVEPLTLPWTECPRAVDGAQTLVGQPVAGLRRWVRTELTGTSSCTHLNDTLRSLQDVTVLAGRLAEVDAGR